MSRIGNNPVAIPEGVTVDIKDNVVTVKGILGELTQNYDSIEIKVEGLFPCGWPFLSCM